MNTIIKKYEVRYEDEIIGNYIIFTDNLKHFYPNEDGIKKIREKGYDPIPFIIKEQKSSYIAFYDNRIKNSEKFGMKILGYQTDPIKLEKVLELNTKIEKNRVYVEEENVIIGEIKYKENSNGEIDIYSTFVDEKMRDKGIASILLEYTVDILKSEGKKITASCPYARKKLQNKDN